jgi:signal transduction histidine kinase
LTRARNELEMRVAQRTAALSKANAELRRQIEERRRLEKELLDITEQERQRIGIDLHDDLGQQLMGIAFMVKGLEQQLERDSPNRAVEANKIHAQVSRTIKHAHDLALDMTAEFEGGSLDLALNQLARRVENLFQVQCRAKIDADLSQLQAAVSSHLYKIAQEALTNAIKHGKARHIVLRLAEESGRVLMSIWNDGSPFHVEASQNSRMGLRIMRYRAHVVGGSLEVQSNEKDGTTVTCALPLTAEACAGATLSISG